MLPFLYEINAATNSYPEVYGVWPNSGTSSGSTAVAVSCNYPWKGTETVTVTIGGQVCTGVSLAPDVQYSNRIFATVPAGSTNGDVVVTVNGKKASCGKGLWSVNGAPVVLAVAPYKILPGGGYNVTILGSGFSNGTISVSFGGVPGTSPVVTGGGTILNVTSPALTPTAAGTTPIDVIVTTSGGGSSVASAGSKLGVYPTSFLWAYVCCSPRYNPLGVGGLATLTDAAGTNNATGSATPANQPTLTNLGSYGALTMLNSPDQHLASNSAPAAMSAPYTVGFTASIPAWSTINGLFGSNTNNTAFSLGAGGLGTTPIFEAGSTSDRMISVANPHATGYPNNFMCFKVNGASSQWYIDGAINPITITGTPGATGWGIGITLGTFAGFPGAWTFSDCWGASGAISDADRLIAQWLSSYFEGTAYP